MSAEAEKYLERAEHVTNVTDKRGRVIDPATRYLRPNERARRQAEASRLKAMLSRQNVFDASMGEESRKMAQGHLMALEDELENHTVPQLSEESRNVLYAELKREEELYQIGLPTRQEMSRNPVGAVDKHIKHTAANKARALKIKNLRMLVDPTSEAIDLCNLENLRKDQPFAYTHESQLPGHMAYTHIPDEKWEGAGLPLVNENSPLAVAERAELEELRQRVAAIEALQNQVAKVETATWKPKRGMSDEKRAEQSRRMKEKWAARRANAETPQG